MDVGEDERYCGRGRRQLCVVSNFGRCSVGFDLRNRIPVGEKIADECSRNHCRQLTRRRHFAAREEDCQIKTKENQIGKGIVLY